jgi:16S rRNA (guanine527-N7)-methyltransferase
LSQPDPKDDLVEAVRRDLVAIGLEGDADAAPALAAYLKLLARWNRTYNLTGAKEVAEIRAQHLVDCMAIAPALRRAFPAQSPIRVLDVGSGAGLPGIVLAVLHPAWQVDCIDAVGKKAAFIRQAAGELNLTNLRSIHDRVEASTLASSTGYNLIISRAFSSLRDFVELTKPLLDSGGVWVAMKGKIHSEETALLPGDVAVSNIQQIDVPGLMADRCLVFMKSKSIITAIDIRVSANNHID